MSWLTPVRSRVTGPAASHPEREPIPLLEEAQYRLWLSIRLRQHRCGRLNQNLVLHEAHHLPRHISIANTRLGCLDIFRADRDSVDAVL